MATWPMPSVKQIVLDWVPEVSANFSIDNTFLHAGDAIEDSSRQDADDAAPPPPSLPLQRMKTYDPFEDVAAYDCEFPDGMDASSEPPGYFELTPPQATGDLTMQYQTQDEMVHANPCVDHVPFHYAQYAQVRLIMQPGQCSQGCYEGIMANVQGMVPWPTPVWNPKNMKRSTPVWDPKKLKPLRSLPGHVGHPPNKSSPSNWQGKVQYARLRKELEAGGKRCEDAVDSLSGNGLEMSFDKEGCRVIQHALQVATIGAAENLVAELHGNVRKLIKSPHGNYVIQLVTESLPKRLASFVTEELKGHVVAVAKDEYGCRIVLRIFQQSTPGDASAALADELLTCAAELCKDPFGHFVMQTLLEYGSPTHKRVIADALNRNIWSFVWNRFASYVIETALENCEAADQAHLLERLLSTGPETVVSMAQSPSGIHVLGALFNITGEHSAATNDSLRFVASQISKSRHGLALLKKDARVAARVASFVEE